jgi:serine/threonine-protein kinase
VRKLGRYALLHRFASGDHGDVYLARLTERLPGGELAVGDLCAVRVVRGDVATDIEHSRLLLAEGATAVRFRHRAAVRVHEVERVGAEPYAASDYCLGQTVGALLQRESSEGGVLDARAVAWLGAEVASALYAASQRAWSPSGTGPMIHGGLSPRSVLVDYSGEVRVLGLGGGRARLYLPVPKSRLAYAAPEVLAGRTPDRRTDIFALGVILHDLLTSTRLFRRATDAETREAIMEGRPPDVLGALAGLDRELAKLIAAMVERAPERRPRDAEEVDEALRQFAGSPEEAQQVLATRLERGFREEREAQRRVVDAAVRRAGSVAGARPPPTQVRAASGSERPALAREPSHLGLRENVPPAPREASGLPRPAQASIGRDNVVPPHLAREVVPRGPSGVGSARPSAAREPLSRLPSSAGRDPVAPSLGRDPVAPSLGRDPVAPSPGRDPVAPSLAREPGSAALARELGLPATPRARVPSGLPAFGRDFGGLPREAPPTIGGSGEVSTHVGPLSPEITRPVRELVEAARSVRREPAAPDAPPAATQRDVPQMMRPVSAADRAGPDGPRAPLPRAAATKVLQASPGAGALGLGVPPPDEGSWAEEVSPIEESITLSGLPAVRSPEDRAAPLRLVPVELADAVPLSGFDELLPELLSGQVPLLAERDDGDTVDLSARKGWRLPAHGSSAPIPLTRRSSKPERLELLSSADETWDGGLGEGPELPAWGQDLDLVPTFALAMGPVTGEESMREVHVADAEGSLQDLLDTSGGTPAPPTPRPDVTPASDRSDGPQAAPLERLPAPPPQLLGSPGALEAQGPGVARYRRLHQLGVSEVAAVFEAQDAVLGRPVALKVSDVGDAGGARLDRDTRIRVLRREGRVAAALFHPRLPALLDAGRDGEVYFLAYQLLEGQDLDRVVAERGPVSPARARALVSDVAEALAYLHARAVSHGDVSAANVLVEPDGRARLLDFSMAVVEGTDHPLGGVYDPAADARALGALGVWMVAGGPKPNDVAKLDPELAAVLARLQATDGPNTGLAAVRAELESAPAAPKPAAPRIPPVVSSPGAVSPLDARERPAAPLGIGFEAVAQALEAHLRRGTSYDPPDRDGAGPLARAIARRLALGPESEAVSALLLAARVMTVRFGMKARQAVAEGLLAPVIGARLLELDERLVGAREADPEPTPLEVATVVEAYALSTQVGEDGRRVSPRRAVLALRERADEGRFDGRVVEALIDHLRSTISALEIAPRERIVVVGLGADDAVVRHLLTRGYPLELHADVEGVVARGFAPRPPWAVLADRALARRLGERLRTDARAREVPLVLLGGGLDDTLDDGLPPGASLRTEIFPRGVAPERVLAALAERARPR